MNSPGTPDRCEKVLCNKSIRAYSIAETNVMGFVNSVRGKPATHNDSAFTRFAQNLRNAFPGHRFAMKDKTESADSGKTIAADKAAA